MIFVRISNLKNIKLYFPDCQIDEFEKHFDLLFEYMEIDDYVIINDLVDGENLINSTFNGFNQLILTTNIIFLSIYIIKK